MAWILLASVAEALLHLTSDQYGVLLVVGTVWFGGICLFNAIRCGRTHCWVDGTLLPVLSVVGGVNLVWRVGIAWGTYLSVLWGVLLASVIIECLVGSYPKSLRTHS